VVCGNRFTNANWRHCAGTRTFKSWNQLFRGKKDTLTYRNSFTICTLQLILWGDYIEKDKLGGYVARVEKKKYIKHRLGDRKGDYIGNSMRGS
jgi:hypothetical protein